jgi:hypothetical protein
MALPILRVPTNISPPMWASHPTRSLLLCLMGFSHLSFSHTSPTKWFSYLSFSTHSIGMPRLASAKYYDKLHPYLANGCTILMDDRSMNWSIDLGMMTNQDFQHLTEQKSMNCWYLMERSSNPITPNPNLQDSKQLSNKPLGDNKKGKLDKTLPWPTHARISNSSLMITTQILLRLRGWIKQF